MRIISITPVLISLLGVTVARVAFAHCPLCTAGAGLAAVGASWLGVSNAAVGVFIGAFAVALGLWVARLLKRQFIPYQKVVLVIVSFVMTVVPLMPLMPGYASFYLNRVYIMSWFLIGALMGGVLVLIAPAVSRKLTAFRKGRTLPYQGVAITLLILLAAAVLFELWL